ncbi:acylaldehyde oxidase [Capsulimonas corticalis]|uniref:Acylaldehyde oxidase n=1 Tax=Capsulimonas corticalis TaxID=2219043 RepID=A0A402CTU1_9BACT|nr:xanthine dehydrogenase family protein molybdopterin-binding subunit [Capsulimonas corticalis]BDI28774.1 acylaldehyde oxidase [Capsulimonas corticalis]
MNDTTNAAGAPMDTASVGKPMDRVDGRLKVTGGAKYAAEFPLPNLAHAVIITSTIAKGRIAKMDTSAADAAPGVIKILTPMNAPRLPHDPSAGPGGESGSPQNRKLNVLQNDSVSYNNQPIGLAIAETLEQAMHAAALVQVEYAEEKPLLDMKREKTNAYQPKSANQEPADTQRGDLHAGKRDASKSVEQTYTTPMENHNPMEPHATTAVWDGDDHLTVYDATQGVFGVQSVLSHIFGLPKTNVRCVSYFVGGGFGSKGSVWSHIPLAALAAKTIQRPVKLSLTRAQMFGMVGYRPQTEQHLMLAAKSDGAITASRHASWSQTSTFDEFVEPTAAATRILYESPAQETSHRLIRLNYGTPTYMRAPGESSGTYAVETAMDELAYALKMDPIQLRLRNYAEADPESKKPWSSKSLRECYQVGADKFAWSRRTPEPRSMRAPDGRLLGLGMATATYPARRSAASALARLLPDGTAYVQAGTQDIGTGTYTIMTQIAADALGLPPERVRFELGDTEMPETPVSGGSQTAASTGSAVKQAGMDTRDQAIQIAIADPASPLHGLTASDIDVKNGMMFVKSQPNKGETYAELIARQKLPKIEVKSQSKPGAEKDQYAMHSFGAVFVEALVDPDLCEVRLNRVVGAYDVGRILNAKTARSQLIGGVVYGVGMALMEQTVPDPRTGRIVNRDLAEYHVPINADIPEIDIEFINQPDTIFNPIGARGVGEIGITGVVAAIGNAVYHATGVRVRDLPITLDKLI